MKSRSKIALFSNEHHFEIWFSKKKTITFFWSKLSKLHKKDPILHVTTTFSLKQEETRSRSSRPIPHSLRSMSYTKPLKTNIGLDSEQWWRSKVSSSYLVKSCYSFIILIKDCIKDIDFCNTCWWTQVNKGTPCVSIQKVEISGTQKKF